MFDGGTVAEMVIMKLVQKVSNYVLVYLNIIINNNNN